MMENGGGMAGNLLVPKVLSERSPRPIQAFYKSVRVMFAPGDKIEIGHEFRFPF
jgi:hypothetical protein